MRFSRVMDRPWAWLTGGSLALLAIIGATNARWPLLGTLPSRAATDPPPVVWVADPGLYPPALLRESVGAGPAKLAVVPSSITSLPRPKSARGPVRRISQARPAGFNELSTDSTDESTLVLKRLPEVEAPAVESQPSQMTRAMELGTFPDDTREAQMPELPGLTHPSFADSTRRPESTSAHPGAGGSFELELSSVDLERRLATEIASPVAVAPLAVTPAFQPRIAHSPSPAPTLAPATNSPARPTSHANTSAAMQSVSARADELTRHGFSLADRGAYYSARAEFIQGLRLLTQALDAQDSDARHSRALAAGLKALDEAEDFIPKGVRLEADLNVTDVISTHETPVLKGFSGLAQPLAAVQHYYTYAQEQLAIAGGNLSAASGALYGLGKIQLALARHSADARQLAGPQAMTFYQAALTTNPQNYRAANELGVLLARYGQLPDAKRVFLASLSTSRQREAWHNLAVVHERLGEIDLAKRAQHEEQLLASGAVSALDATARVSWVNAQEFAKSGIGHDANAPVVSAAPRIAAAPKPAEKKTSSFSWPWK